MKEFIFTFGYGHNPGIGYYTVVEAENENEARQLMNKAFSGKWAFCYTTREEAGVYEYKLTEIPFN